MKEKPTKFLGFGEDSQELILEAGVYKCVEIYPNTGQISGIPKNPRYIVEEKLEALKNSIKDDPEFLNLRPLVLIPYAGAYVVLNGNMRLVACMQLGITEVPGVVLNPNTPVEKLKALMIKDNISYGRDDFDILANEFDEIQLTYWGMDLPDIEIDNDTPDKDDEGPQSFKLTIDFKSNFEQFEPLKEKILKLIEGHEGITLK